MNLPTRFLNIILALLLAFHPSLLQAADLVVDPTGQMVPTVSALAATEEHQEIDAQAAKSETTLNDTTNFVMGNTLSRADDEEVSIESNDPFYSTSGSWGQSYDDLWWLKRVKADEAWLISRGTSVPVAVIDTGLDYNHPDIAANLWTNSAERFGIAGIDDDNNGFIDDVNGWDFYNGDNDPLDDHGHGTAVSGVIAAIADNGIGIAGIAPERRRGHAKDGNECSRGTGFGNVHPMGERGHLVLRRANAFERQGYRRRQLFRVLRS